VILGISLAVLAAFGARRLLDACGTARRRTVVAALLVAAAMIDLRPVLRLQPVWPEPPAFYTTIAARDDVVLAEFPFSVDGSINSIPQMYFSIWHGREMINGYSGFSPDSYDALMQLIWKFPAAETLAAFRSRGVTHVTVTCALMPRQSECDDVLGRIAGSPAFSLIGSVRWEGLPARLYELLPPD
jgi:hypothetical protein